MQFLKKSFNVFIFFFTFVSIFLIESFSYAVDLDAEINVDWALFPKVYCDNSTTFIPVKFTVKTSEPENFNLRPVIINGDTAELEIPSSTPEMLLDKNEKSFIKFIPIEFLNSAGSYSLNLVFVDDNGIIFDNVSSVYDDVSVFCVNLWVILALLLMNIFIILFYKKCIAKFFGWHVNKLSRWIANTVISLELFVFSYLFMAPWNLSLAITLVLLAFLLCGKESKIFMPLVFLVQLLMLEFYMDLLFAVDTNGMVLSFSEIFMTSLLLFFVTFFFRNFGMIVSLILSLVSIVYYMAQLYYYMFFKDFFPIASLYQVKEFSDIAESVFSLTTSVELFFVLLIVINILVFLMYKTFFKKQVSKNGNSDIDSVDFESQIVEKRKIRKSKKKSLNVVSNLISLKFFNKF